jgi:hypothetical protein
MSYWVREVAGWALILVGLAVFLTAYNLLLDKRVIEAAPLTFMGYVVFRGGVHLLKVAMAAQTARHLLQTVNPAPKRAPRLPGRPIGPTPVKSVKPGPRE